MASSQAAGPDAASMAPPAPSMLPDSARWFQVRWEARDWERSPRSPVQIE